MSGMSTERWEELARIGYERTWTRDQQWEVGAECARARVAEAALRDELAFEQAWRKASELGDAFEELKLVRAERDALLKEAKLLRACRLLDEQTIDGQRQELARLRERMRSP